MSNVIAAVADAQPEALAELARLIAAELRREPPPAVLDRRAAAAMCGMSPSKWDDYAKAGLVPAGSKVGAKLGWGRDELQAWVDEGRPRYASWCRTWPGIRAARNAAK